MVDCLNSPENSKLAAPGEPPQSIRDFVLQAANCDPYLAADVPFCDASVENRIGRCRCFFYEFSNLKNFTFFYSFAYDSVSTLVQALNLLQNDCGYLNSRLDNELVRKKDFCKMTEFTPADISFAIQQVNFTGRTGPISFIPQTAIRRESYYYLMQYQNSSDSVLVGSSVGTNGSLVLNVSAMVFPGGRIPVSGKNNYHY